MTALKAAANDLINMIVQDVQTPYYTKLAIVPYSNSVNIGSTYMTNVRGAVPAAKTITSASRSSSGGNYYVTFNSTAHGFAVNDYVYITGVTNMTNVNNKAFQITSKTANAFTVLYGTSNPGTSSGTGGQATCTTYGCSYYRFTRNDNQVDVFSASTACVTERTGSDRYTDTAPSTSKVAFKYSKTLNDCPSTSAVPLSTDKTALHAVVNSLTDGGSTAGHIGLAWGWQSLTQSPFTIPAFSADYKYKTIIILLSDGVNTQDRWYGNGSDQSTQVDAREALLCSAVKAANVTIYAIQVNTDGAATQSVMQNCASDTDKFFLLTTADQIITTFDQIGKALSDLRLSS